MCIRCTESKTSGKTGYSPALGNEWLPDMCGNRLSMPLSDKVIYDHMTGKHTVGADHAPIVPTACPVFALCLPKAQN
jgi:hypothetical protein